MNDSYSFKWFQGKAAHGIGFFKEVTPTIVCADGHVPAVIHPRVRHNADNVAYERKRSEMGRPVPLHTEDCASSYCGDCL